MNMTPEPNKNFAEVIKIPLWVCIKIMYADLEKYLSKFLPKQVFQRTELSKLES